MTTDYGDRDVLDKLGIKPGQAVAFDEEHGPLEAEVRDGVLQRVGRLDATGDESLDVVLAMANASMGLPALLLRWKARLKPAGSIWVLTPKRGQAGYVGERDLIAAGAQAGLVDNKICSVSATTGAMRFVIRRADRAKGA